MQDRVRSIRNTRKPSPKPTLEECVAILDEAASLPRPEEAPGGTLGGAVSAPFPVFTFNII